MKRVLLQRKMTISCLFLLFFFGGVHVFAFDTFPSNQETYVPNPGDEEKTEGTSNQSSGSILEKKTFPESDESFVFEKGDDGMLKAPPTFDDGGTYPPGGQVNPILPLNDGFSVLLSAVFIYAIIRLLRSRKIV